MNTFQLRPTHRRGAFLILALTMLLPQALGAIVPVSYAPVALVPVDINLGAGDQYDPHVSGDWVAYTSGAEIRYFNFSTNVDAAIPLGGAARDLLAGVSGSKIAFSRVIVGVKVAVMVFDAAAPGTPPVEINPAAATTRFGAAIGGQTVAYIDFGLQANGELVIHDLGTSASTRMTNDTSVDGNPMVSDDGTVVVWEHCVSSLTNCDIWQAVKTNATWVASVVSDSTSPEGNPDSNGTLVVYDSQRSGKSSIFMRPVAGGAEVELEFPGVQRDPRIAGDFIVFQSAATIFDTSDIYIYDTVNNRLFQITDTPLVTEQLNDITVLPDGRVRVVWSSDEDGDTRNVKSATLRFPNLAPGLSYSTDPGYVIDGVSPDSGLPLTSFTYKAVYADFENQPPQYIQVCVDGTCHAMAVDGAADPSLRDGHYQGGEQYAYSAVLPSGPHSYHFEASDGIDVVRLPAAGNVTGPLVSQPVTGLIEDLIALIKSFNLKQGIENSLDAKLQNVLAARIGAENGDQLAACGKLSAFISEVQAQSGKSITSIQAQQLLDLTNQIKTALACP